jgi:hypothetical protein
MTTATVRLRSGEEHTYHSVSQVRSDDRHVVVHYYIPDDFWVGWNGNPSAPVSGMRETTESYLLSSVASWHNGSEQVHTTPPAQTMAGLRAELVGAKDRADNYRQQVDAQIRERNHARGERNALRGAIDQAIDAAGVPRSLSRKEANEALNRVMTILRAANQRRRWAEFAAGGVVSGIHVAGLGYAGQQAFKAEHERGKAEHARDVALRERDEAWAHVDTARMAAKDLLREIGDGS